MCDLDRFFKSQSHIMNKSGGDFQQGGCLYKPPSVLNEYANTSGHLSGLRSKPEKSRPVNFWLWQ